MPEPLVTVVTPVHNEEVLLPECIESVLAQTHKNWQYVIMDNACTDRSREIAERYAKQDSRIRVHRTEHLLDVMGSQNAAFRQTSPDSKYCKMVHGDDWLFPDCLAKMVALAEAQPSVGVVGSYRLEGSLVCPATMPYPSPIVSGKEVCRMRLLGLVNPFGSATAHLFRTSDVLGRSKFLNEGDPHADAGICFEILQHSDFGFVHQVLAYIRQRPGGVTDWSEARNTLIVGQLRQLKEYGAGCLERHELEQRIAAKLAEYYRFLGKSVLRGHDREFWEFHRKALADLGYPMNRPRVATSVTREILRLAAHPEKAVRRAAGLAKRRLH